MQFLMRLAAQSVFFKLGLIGASTPFITGRPVTLFENEKIYESGAVGVALLHTERLRRDHRLSFLAGRPISGHMTVTRLVYASLKRSEHHFDMMLCHMKLRRESYLRT
jgi:hypothetical protein